ncbi:MAG TPA: type I methionyl aminopeptidase [Bacillota bacterium]|nr:type I methionyl aminopeptidase [Bacillota bacterium]
MIQLKTASDFEKMRVAGNVVALTLKALEDEVRPGISTKELDDLAKKVFDENGAISSSYHYGDPPFPGIICISPNRVIVHGIPSTNVILKEGDIVTCDVCCSVNGFHADAARTFAVGNISPEARKLMDVTKESFFRGYAAVKEGNRIGDVSNAVQQYAESFGYGVIRELTGHGVGFALHEDPDVPNYGRAGHGPRIKEGMAFCIEPMISEGSPAIVLMEDDWTVCTRDGKNAAHYENTVIVTSNGPEIITLLEETHG